MIRHLKSNTIIYLILIIFSVFNIIKKLNFPVYIDEASTYIDYTSKGLWISLSKYYEPNNHVFFSLIVTLFQKLPIDPLLAMRIPTKHIAWNINDNYIISLFQNKI
jgi:hypothetical protein